MAKRQKLELSLTSSRTAIQADLPKRLRRTESNGEIKILNTETIKRQTHDIVLLQSGGITHGDRIFACYCSMPFAVRTFVGSNTSMSTARRTDQSRWNQNPHRTARKRLSRRQRHFNIQAFQSLRFRSSQKIEVAPQPFEQLIKGGRKCLERPEQRLLCETGHRPGRGKRFGSMPARDHGFRGPCRHHAPNRDFFRFTIVDFAPRRVTQNVVSLLQFEELVTLSAREIGMKFKRTTPKR